jgi:hypothetical protein
VEEVTRCSRTLLLASPFFFFLFGISLQAQRPSERYHAAVVAGRIEPRVKVFVAGCVGKPKLPKPVQLYSQGSWFVTPDLATHIKEQGSDDDGTAQVWSINGKPRALSLWTHDDEFDRNTLACLNDSGVVIRQVNEYIPGLSEPELHYISVHTFSLANGGQYRSSNRYTDWNGQPIPAPKLTSEDRDFIAGERRYTKWSDFDLASALQRGQ